MTTTMTRDGKRGLRLVHPDLGVLSPQVSIFYAFFFSLLIVYLQLGYVYERMQQRQWVTHQLHQPKQVHEG